VPKPPTAAKPATEAKEPAKEPDEDEALAQHVQGGDNRTVPFSALEKVRADWKSKAAAHEAEARVLRQQLEAIQRNQQAPPPQPPPAPSVMQFQAPPDFNADPQGFMQTMVANQQRALLNERLNHSEALVRERISEEDLAKYVGEFKAAAEKEPTLWGKLYAQPSPYAWMTKTIDTMRKHAEIGDDPSAYEARMREKLEAEFRAKWEAEAGGTLNGAPAPSVTAGMQPSLASVRSVAGRTTNAWTGPPDMNDILRRPDKRAAARH
jgi:hypothetical protein